MSGTPGGSAVLLGLTGAVRVGIVEIVASLGWRVIEGQRSRPISVATPTVVIASLDAHPPNRVRRLANHFPNAMLVGLVQGPTVEVYMRCLKAGVFVLLDPFDPEDEIRATLEAARARRIRLSIETFEELTSRLQPSLGECALTDLETAAMRALASGLTLVEIGYEIGYSRRSTSRIIARAVERLGASSREEAIVIATRAGLLNAAP